MVAGKKVAPRAGAWIETLFRGILSGYGLSPPARGRGLKHHLDTAGIGNWESPPARGRGLKLLIYGISLDILPSPPARGRGLKLVMI